MTALRDELVSLTTDQPAQPGDRLMSVNQRARRIRRTRVLATAAAALVIATPVAIAISAAGDSDPRPSVVATAISDWPDRSALPDRQVTDGAVQEWTAQHGRSDARQHWLYVNAVTTPEPDAVKVWFVAWVQDGKVIAGSSPSAGVDADGRPLSRGEHWSLAAVDVAQAPPVISFLMPDIKNGKEVPDRDQVFLLADPAARHLRWTTTPLASAPTAGVVTSGRMTSDNGVFTGSIGPLTGRLSVTVDELPADPVQLTFPDAEPFLKMPPVPGAAGQRLLSHGSQMAGDDSAGIDLGKVLPDGSGAVRITCYGGGTVNVLLDEQTVGSAACDLVEHEVALTTSPGTHTLRLRGNRWQAISWAVVDIAP
jgi:hypothetical protein